MNTSSNFPDLTRPVDPSIPAAVHVWHASVQFVRNLLPELELTLDFSERVRAGAFHHTRDRESFVLARGMLRWLLGKYVDVPPAEIEIKYGEFGKPYFSPDHIEFNVSHSGGQVLIAFARGLSIGVDIEIAQPGVDLADIVTRFFSAEELAEWNRIPTEFQTDAFYRLWTRKEAFVKGLGLGFSLPLDSFAVTFAPGSKCRVTRTPTGFPASSEWSLVDLTESARSLTDASTPGTYAALAVPSPRIAASHWFIRNSLP
ncbi:MAG: 4'-phosphopantetheinyl transferase superfamily protein [Planctomycetota bacterium]|nr:4'-phosphopantetheinyl transferase superfamily protein [Planctomycetota bacterium]